MAVCHGGRKVAGMDSDLDRMLTDARLVGHVREVGRLDASVAVPQLIGILRDGSTGDAPAKAALLAIGSFGPKAAASVDILERLAVNHGDDGVRRGARMALRDIMSAKATEHPPSG